MEDCRITGRSLAVPSVLLFAALTALYILTSPALVHQHWDSLEYPHACETRAPKSIWGNHPLGHVVLCGAFRAAAAAGYDGRALPLMSVGNAVIGATTVVTFMWLLQGLGMRMTRAIAWSLVMAGTFGFWLYAGTADIYGLSLLAMLLAWIALLRAADAPGARRYVIAGVAVGLAVVTHQFNGPLLLAAFIALYAWPAAGRPRPRPQWVMLLGAIAAVIVVVGYSGLGVLATGSTSWRDLQRWLIDYGADPTYGRSFNLVGLVKAMWTAGDTLLRVTWSAPAMAVRMLILIPMVVVLVAGVLATPFARGRWRPAAISAIAQLLVGVPLIWWWAPDHVGKWWLLMLPAFVVVQATGIEVLDTWLAGRHAASGRRSSAAFDLPAIAIAAACLAFTGLVTMRAMHRTDVAFDDAMAQWARHTQPGDVTIESDVTAHLLFWTKRPNALFLYRTIQASQSGSDRFAVLRSIVDGAIREGRGVFYVPGVANGFSEADLQLVGVTRDEVETFFESYGRQGPVFRYRPKEGAGEREVYRLTPPR